MIYSIYFFFCFRTLLMVSEWIPCASELFCWCSRWPQANSTDGSSLEHPEGHRRGAHTRSPTALRFKCCGGKLLNVLWCSKTSETAVGHESEAAGCSPASASSLMNVVVLKYSGGKSGPAEVIRMKYRSGSGLPAIANGGAGSRTQLEPKPGAAASVHRAECSRACVEQVLRHSREESESETWGAD